MLNKLVILSALFVCITFLNQHWRRLFWWWSKINGLMWTEGKPIVDPVWVALEKTRSVSERSWVLRHLLQILGKSWGHHPSLCSERVCCLPLSSWLAGATRNWLCVRGLLCHLSSCSLISFFLWHSDAFHKHQQPDIPFQSHNSLTG